MNVAEYVLLYRRDGIVQILSSADDQLPNGAQMRALASEVIDTLAPTTVVTNETIRFLKCGNHSDMVESRRVISRIENFVAFNQHWTDLCCTGGVLSRMVGLVCVPNEDVKSSPWCLYKEKLNIKPAGSAGFAPHLDSPSLRVTGLCDTFVTVMIAIDDMTIENGCLQVCRGNWSEWNAVLCEEPCVVVNGIPSNPDGNGRRGAILNSAATELMWEPVECLSGDVFIFSGWIPHRSSCNMSQLQRRAVFLTYNQSEDGELSDTYYLIMRDLRSAYLKHYLVSMQAESI